MILNQQVVKEVQYNLTIQHCNHITFFNFRTSLNEPIQHNINYQPSMTTAYSESNFTTIGAAPPRPLSAQKPPKPYPVKSTDEKAPTRRFMSNLDTQICATRLEVFLVCRRVKTHNTQNARKINMRAYKVIIVKFQNFYNSLIQLQH